MKETFAKTALIKFRIFILFLFVFQLKIINANVESGSQNEYLAPASQYSQYEVTYFPLDTANLLREIGDFPADFSIELMSALMLIDPAVDGAEYIVNTIRQLDNYYRARYKPGSRPFIVNSFVTSDREAVSLVLNNRSVVRIYYNRRGRLKLVELNKFQRKNTDVYDNKALHKLMLHMLETHTRFLTDQRSIEEMNQMFWAVPAEFALLRPESKKPRLIEADEMAAMIIELDRYILFGLGEGYSEKQLNLPPQDKAVLLKNADFSESSPLYRVLRDYYESPSLNRIDKRVGEHIDLVRNMDTDPEELTLFLARDAISAREFYEYMNRYSTEEVPVGLVYQPGMPARLRHSDYASTPTMSLLISYASQFYDLARADAGLPKIKRKKKTQAPSPDELNPNDEEFAALYESFKSRLKSLIDRDPNIYKEAKTIYNHILLQGAGAYKKVKFVDLNGTGKTLLLMKAVLEIFTEYDEEDSFENVGVFIGYGRGEMNSIPKIAHRNPFTRSRFTDYQWPFSMTRRTSEGEVFFKGVKSRSLYLLQLYHSVQLYNGALQYLSMKDETVVTSDGMVIDLDAETLAEQHDAKIIMDAMDAETLAEQTRERVESRTSTKPRKNLFRNRGRFLNAWAARKNDGAKGYIRPGFFGDKRPAIYQKLTEWFGPENVGWTIMHKIDGEYVTREEAINYYEDAYYVYFSERPEVLEPLLEVAGDIFDNSPDNVHSGLSYSIQKQKGEHIQDIAIRRVVRRLGKTFRGDKLIQVRGRRSPAAHLSPGEVVFHLPDLILLPELTGWWKSGSIESFYQSTKAIILLPGAKNLNVEQRALVEEVFGQIAIKWGASDPLDIAA